ncbi:hypothetical protein ABPG75_003464 [Micractinium tetrahymenae]
MVSRLLVACVFAACLSLTHARLLRQTGSTFDFSYSNNTYIGSVTLVGSGTYTNSAEACIQGCVDDADCVYWSWCPADQASGCAVPGLNGASDTTVAAKGCVLSYDSDKNRNAVFVMSGDSVTFAGGNNPASWIDPSGTPAECNGWFSGDQWSGDEIECHVCDSEYQLKCDLDTDLIGDDSVNVVDWSKLPQNQCDWAGIAAKLPTCAVEPVQRILATWNPKE